MTERMELENNIIKISRSVEELKWANIFHDTVRGYEWYDNCSLSLGRWAIGYNYAYVLSRVLQEIQPESILELGMGQSTTIVDMYSKYCYNMGKMVRHDIIEQDSKWIEFYKKNNSLSNTSNIFQRDVVFEQRENGPFYKYAALNSILQGKKYTLISVDGPWGGENISRTDLIEFIPDILEDDWVILLDDCQRRGEKRMIELLTSKLNSFEIIYESAVYPGEKDAFIITSSNYKFLTSM